GFQVDAPQRFSFCNAMYRLLSVLLGIAAFMTPTATGAEPKDSKIYELRIYYAPEGKLDALHARFRDHTLKLFEKHGMENIAYFNRMKDMKDADVTLFYMLAHKSEDAAKESFNAFRNDPDWIAARKASEEKAGGSLTIKDGVKSEF